MVIQVVAMAEKVVVLFDLKTLDIPFDDESGGRISGVVEDPSCHV
jgi:hypothetical protein